ncbi:restriction endonuclease subunit S [Acinetobacter bereziniae]|uniref:restriction endonuclease subunit S n=1 Tax=Acinetobacter bereziniae TaxID=106648 RepID=UPI00073E87DD|nr:restriction endonuclease subunit S [Acinetobacter bereziniae]RSZ26445.1 restriction endonuclease subunit S [Acinetobacter bereziniae]
MDFKEYPSYKDSGVEWIGNIPSHWSIKRFGYIFRENKIKNNGLIETNVLSLSYGRIKEKNIEDNKGLLPESFETYQIIQPNDIIFRFTDLQNDKRSLRSAISKFHGIITSAYIGVRTTANAEFYNYLFRAYDQQKVFYSMGDGMRQSLKIDELNRMPIVFPSKVEQQQIVSFLDSETSRIDNLIAKQEKLIERLEEHRNTLTAHTIEKGIKPDTKMINSGVEWLGEVPESWKIGRLKNFAKVNPIIKKFSLDDDELIEFIPMSNVDDKKGVIASIDYRKFSEVSSGYTAFNTSDVVFAKITPCMENGNCAIIPELKYGFGYGTTEFIVFRVSKVIKTEFLYFLLRSKKLRDICTAFMTGTAGQQRISSDFLANYPLALPELKEQQEIIDFLHEKNQKIDTLIAKQRELITKLKNYRTSIISHAVTGKIDVQEFGA